MTLTAPTRHVLERRMMTTEFREVPGSNGRQRWATAVTYNRADSYGTIWLPGCFNDGLRERLPTILYGHDWYDIDSVLGQAIDFADGPDGVDVLLEFADPALVPSAARAIALTTGPAPILKDVSVGFDRQAWLTKDELTPEQLALGGEEAMQRALMDELSIVVRGAVPGAALRGRRSWVIDGNVTETDPEATEPDAEPELAQRSDVLLERVTVLARQVVAGDLGMDEGRAAVSLMAAMDAPMSDDMMTAAAGVDAALDAALACCDGVDLSTWPTEAVQLVAFTNAADAQMDDLMAALGVTDPDETAAAPSMPMNGQMAAPEAEHREPEFDETEMVALAARAKDRSR